MEQEAVLEGARNFGIVYVLFYFLPLFIAMMRKHVNTVAIGVLTLLLGWTLIGWIVALVWSFTASVRKER